MTQVFDHGTAAWAGPALKVTNMKKITIVLAALFAVGLYAVCPSCTSAKPETKGTDVGVQEKAETDSVTFHVIGMKKTASGAT